MVKNRFTFDDRGSTTAVCRHSDFLWPAKERKNGTGVFAMVWAKGAAPSIAADFNAIAPVAAAAAQWA